MKGIYKFELYYSRSTASGIFVATNKQVEKLIESKVEVYFGEILGKHSEVFTNIDPGMINLVTEKEEVVKLFEEHDLSIGHNPFNYTVSSIELEDGRYLEDVNVRELVDLLLE